MRILAQRKPARCKRCLSLLADWPATSAEWLSSCHSIAQRKSLSSKKTWQCMLQPTGREVPLECWLLPSRGSRLYDWSLLYYLGQFFIL